MSEENEQKNKTLADRAREWVGQKVVVEGPIPIQTGPQEFAFSPSIGRLKRVYSDGFELQSEDRTLLYSWSSIRSLGLMPEETRIVTPKQGLITPGRN